MEAEGTIKEITETEHTELLKIVYRLPFADWQAGIYQKSLKELFENYNKQIKALRDTVTAYNEVALLIRQRQPLINDLKYVRVRRIEQLSEFE